MKVLVVEDDKLQREVMAAQLASKGRQVITAPSGEAAIDTVLATDDLDAVLVDINLPGIGGLETAKRIRAIGGKRGRVPIMGMSAAPPPNPDKKFVAAMDGFLPKDGHFVELLDAKLEETVATAEARVIFDQQVLRVAPSMSKQVWDSLPRVVIICTFLSMFSGVVVWLTGGLKPQSQIDISEIRKDLASLQAQLAGSDVRVDGMRSTIPSQKDISNWEAHLSRLDARFDELNGRLSGVEYQSRDSAGRINALTTVPARGGR